MNRELLEKPFEPAQTKQRSAWRRSRVPRTGMDRA